MDETSEPVEEGQDLTDFLDLEGLQEIQDAFSVVTRLKTTIVDSTGKPITAPTDLAGRMESDRMLQQLMEGGSAEEQAVTAPIVVDNRQIGSISIQRSGLDPLDGLTEHCRIRMEKALGRVGMSPEARKELLDATESVYSASPASSMQLLYLIANAIARLCWQQHHLSHRVNEMEVLYEISKMMAGHTDLNNMLAVAARSIGHSMRAVAVNIRLLEHGASGQELVSHASYGMPRSFANLGRSLINRSEMIQACMRGEVVHIADMESDPRVYYQKDATELGYRSMLGVGIMYQQRPVGTVQVFTEDQRQFNQDQVHLLEAIAQLLATAIENKRLDEQRERSEKLVKNVRLAADIQRRMLPARSPDMDGMEWATCYVPSHDLGGDFYDFIPLGEGALGWAVADVVGKGVPAALMMASVRSLIRAYAPAHYDLDKMLSQLNETMANDDLDNGFATIFYATIDPKSRRMTYCNAGHEPPMVLRAGRVVELEEGGLIVGIDATAQYEKGVWDLEPGDLIMAYTDGMIDAMDPAGRRIGRDRLRDLFAQCADKSAQQTVDFMLSAMRQHVGGRRGNDDTTLVCLRMK